MTTLHAPDSATDLAGGQREHADGSGYVKVWALLILLLVVSVIGPMLGITLVTLVTAFGVALVKAYLVAKHFMHIGLERRYVVYLLVTCIGFIVLFWAGTAPDVMRHEGTNWRNVSAKGQGAAAPQVK